MASTDLRNVPRSTEGAEATESSCESFAAPALEDGVLFEFAAATLSVVRATAAAGVDTGAGPTDSIPGTGRPRGAVLRLGRSPDCSEACSTSGLSAFVPPAGSASGIDVVASEGPTRGISAGAGVAIGSAITRRIALGSGAAADSSAAASVSGNTTEEEATARLSPVAVLATVGGGFSGVPGVCAAD